MRTAALLLGLLTLAASAQDEPAKKELALLQGSWKRVSAEVNGKKVADSVLKNTTLVIEGDRYILKTGDEKRTGTIKIDPTQTPKHITLSADSGPNKGKSLLGIYELKDDIWRYCVAVPEQNRPSEFSAEMGAIYVNKRVTPE